MTHKRTATNQHGIMLIEVLLLTMLVSILAIIIIPRFLSITDNARYEACRTNVANIDTLVQQFYIREATWPAGDLSDIGTNINYFPAGALPDCPVTSGASYTLFSPTHRVTGHLRGDPSHP